jgi:hypothetical protein
MIDKNRPSPLWKLKDEGNKIVIFTILHKTNKILSSED